MKISKQSEFVQYSIAKSIFFKKKHLCGIPCTEQMLIWEQLMSELSWKTRNQRKAGDQLTMWVSGSGCYPSAVQQHKPYSDIPCPPPLNGMHGRGEDCAAQTPQRRKDRVHSDISIGSMGEYFFIWILIRIQQSSCLWLDWKFEWILLELQNKRGLMPEEHYSPLTGHHPIINKATVPFRSPRAKLKIVHLSSCEVVYLVDIM